jgi:hypothetical protein
MKACALPGGHLKLETFGPVNAIFAMLRLSRSYILRM